MTSLAMVGRGVISERGELHAVGLKDCTQASAMRCCADHGIVFPLAGNLEAEREALERSDSYPDETGAPMWAIVQAMERRYGYSGEPIAVMATAVRTPGHTLLMQGPFDHFPLFQRRWQLGGTFGHAVSYRVLSATEGTLLDPLAPMGWPGDTVTPEVMERFCWGPSYIRSMEWAPEDSMSIYVRDNRAGRFTIPAGKVVHGYVPSGSGWAVAQTRAATPDATSGPFDYSLMELGGTRIMRHVPSGTFEGQFLDATEVLETMNPVPDPDVKHKVTVLVDGAVWKEGTI